MGSHPLVDVLRPDVPLTVSEWADRHRVLSPKGSAEPGRWRTSRTPYLREIMDVLSDGSAVTDVCVMKGAQLGFTEVGLNWIMWTIDASPCPVMAVQPTLDMVKRIVRQKLDPAIRETKRVSDKLPPPRAKDGGNSMFAKEFPGGTLLLTGANSATGMRSASVKRLFFDEIDAYPADLDGEGDPIQLALARTRTYHRAKRFYISTPTITGASRVESLYQDTDQRRYFVPCPECGEMQTIEWERIRWDSADLDVPAWMECATCEARIEEHRKTQMLRDGEWRATAPENASATVVGYHLSSLYSPYGWYSWSTARDEWLKAQGKPSLLKGFMNTVLGQSYRESGEVPAWRRLYARREPYRPGTIPKGGVILTAGADVQKDRIEMELRAWGRRHESWSVDYLVFEGDTSDPDGPVWRDLDEALARTYAYEAADAETRIERAAVDSAYQSQVVYTWARRHDPRRVSVVRGVPTQRAIIGTPSVVDVSFRGQKMKRGMRLWPIGVSLAKGELYGWLRQDPPTDTELAPHGWLHFPEYGEEWFRQLTAEELVAKTGRTGHITYEWVKRRERNEALDCAVYARAAASMLGIDRWTDKDWDALERQFGLHGTGEIIEPEEGRASAPAPEAPIAEPAPKPARERPKKRSSIWGKKKSIWR